MDRAPVAPRISDFNNPDMCHHTESNVLSTEARYQNRSLNVKCWVKILDFVISTFECIIKPVLVDIGARH